MKTCDKVEIDDYSITSDIKGWMIQQAQSMLPDREQVSTAIAKNNLSALVSFFYFNELSALGVRKVEPEKGQKSYRVGDYTKLAAEVKRDPSIDPDNSRSDLPELKVW